MGELQRYRLSSLSALKYGWLRSRAQFLPFPSTFNIYNNRIDTAACHEAKQIVGDYCDYNNEEYILYVAHISGEGKSAAYLMSNFQANLSSR